MASDGDLNVGISSEDELNAFVSEKRGQGTYLAVLGFGSGNYQDAKMETLADHGNGSYHYIDSADEAARVYERFLAAGAVPVADDVKLQVEFDSQMVASYRLIGYANRVMADDDFRNDGADAGELCAGAELTVAYEVVLTDEGRRAKSEPWLACAVRYQPAGERAGRRRQSSGSLRAARAGLPNPATTGRWPRRSSSSACSFEAPSSSVRPRPMTRPPWPRTPRARWTPPTAPPAASWSISSAKHPAMPLPSMASLLLAEVLVGGFLLNYASASRELLVRCQGVPTRTPWQPVGLRSGRNNGPARG